MLGKKKILIKKNDIQYNLSTQMHSEWQLHSHVTSRKIFTIIEAKENLHRGVAKEHAEDTRRKNNLHKKNKQRNSTLTMPWKTRIFIKEITYDRTSSKCRKKSTSS
ncbi:hypothetical protein C922_05266 [Plasmodium inui San Antonio 1]|uniref:Uncharacterized protein n=1 Tax=Plasmodium inui San Antonio 1 TaxID=1237626 RepID=W6ZTU3_9APIC|nr:hypothetical protein C922_05266 [Plasmodium inui San Antonio 1]EUD64347.1 hypothetical protein C922_05266 [Plasmodium inui San Antonio 1]